MQQNAYCKLGNVTEHKILRTSNVFNPYKNYIIVHALKNRIELLAITIQLFIITPFYLPTYSFLLKQQRPFQFKKRLNKQPNVEN